MEDALSRHDLLRTRVKRFARMLHQLEAGEVRAVHQTRVASRRLREVLPILQVDPRLAAKLMRRLRRVTRALGPVREADVMLALIAERQARAGEAESKAFVHMEAQVRAARERAARQGIAKPTLAEVRRLAKKLDKTAKLIDKDGAGPRRSRGLRWALEARASRRADSLRQAMRSAGAVYLAERLHTVRIALKKLRYALELVDEVAGRKQTADVRRLRRAQETLGCLHDLQVLLDRARQEQAALSPPDVATWGQFDRLIRTLENDCRRVHARYMRERPTIEALCQRLVARPSNSAQRAG